MTLPPLRFTGRARTAALATACALALAACGETAKLPESAGVGPSPTIPEPNRTLIPTVKVAPAKGWAEGTAPKPADGLAVEAFARGLDHPRWLHVLPNGDVLVAESNRPPREEPDPGLVQKVKSWVMQRTMAKAGAGVPSANRITLLRDADGDGRAELKTPFLENLMSPFGMALVGDTLYIANADAVVRVPYKTGDTKIDATPEKVVDLPGGPINHHWTKSLVASPDGSRLYVGVGSNSNVGERGIAAEEGRAAIWEIDPRAKTHRIFASGLRNPVGVDFEPTTRRLWTVVNERDELGSDLVPDYLTSVQDGGFYGFPWSYWGQHVDTRVEPPRPDLVQKAITPDYGLGSHVAPLGLAFAAGAKLPPPFDGAGAFVGEHGSWNRKPISGYRVRFVPFADGKPSGPPRDVLTGFVTPEGDASGRPVGVVIDKRGALLVADDVGNVVWRVRGAGG
jgi:glucose/arabinose dehydrogenase